MLVVLLIVALGTFCPLNCAALDIKLLTATDGVQTGIFSDAFLLSLPECDINQAKVFTLLYREYDGTTDESKTVTVPKCSELEGLPSYLLNNLRSGIKYSMKYKSATQISETLVATTVRATDFNNINVGLQGRSGAMVVITVILVLAIVGLLAGLIFISFFSG